VKRTAPVLALLTACATFPATPVPAMPPAPEGRLVALTEGQPAPAEMVCMPPALADWLWGAQERAEAYRARLVQQPACDAPWGALGLGFAAGAAAGAGTCAAVRR
jgi:hypothetical protein